MKKILIYVLICLMLLVGCSSEMKPEASKAETSTKETPGESTQQKEEVSSTLNVVAPGGAPALATIPLMLSEANQVEVVNGAEILQAELIKQADQKAIVIAPLNLGAKLQSANKTNYLLHSIATWGNLYIVKVKDAQEDLKLGLFGEQAVVGLVYKNIKDKISETVTEQWLSSVSDVQAALLSGEVNMGLIAEPALTATLAKAKEANIELEVVYNVQDLYKEVNGVSNFPQAAIFVDKKQYETNGLAIDAAIDQMRNYINQVNKDMVILSADIDNLGNEKLGVPKGQLVAKAFPRMNLNVVKATDAISEIESFLKLFNIELNTDALVK